MSVPKKIFSLFAAGALVAVTFTGASTVTADAPAEAASCAVSNLGWWSVKNVSCTKARHYNTISGTTTKKFAPWATAGNVSDQAVCWANATGYGVEVII